MTVSNDVKNQTIGESESLALSKGEAGAVMKEEVHHNPQGTTGVTDGNSPEVDENGAVHYQHPLLDATISADHWRELTVESAITPELIVARGYMTVEDGEESRRFLGEYGITPKAQKPEHFPGLLVPMYEVDGSIRIQWKPATALVDGKRRKYVSQVKMPNVLDVHPSMIEAAKDVSRRLWIGEGVKKGDALASRGEVCISLTGVDCWKSQGAALPAWNDIPRKDREVVIVYDADGAEKAGVTRAMKELGAWLQGKGAKVRYLLVPGEVNGTKVKGVDDYLAAGGTVDQLLAQATTQPPEFLQTDDEFTDARMAERVAEQVLADRFIWVAGMRVWMTWNGSRWIECPDEVIGDAIRRWALEGFNVAAKRTRPDKAALDGWRSMLAATRERAVRELAKGIVLRRADELDADPDLLNTQSGVVDLRTGELHKPDPAMFMTKITSGAYRPGFTHPDWEAALEAIPEDVRGWLQVRMGQGATGHVVSDDIMLVLQGSGENGKTCVTSAGPVPALGDYGSAASHKLFVKGNEHSTERADLRGRRYLVAEELTEGRSIDVTALKQIQGTGRIKAHYMHKDNIEFEPSHSLFVTTNYVPIVSEVDHGTWRRLALVRFPFTFKKPDEELVGELDRRGDMGGPGKKPLRDRIREGKDDQHDAIVAWLVEGAMRWYADPAASLALPKRVKADTRAWQADADRVLGFWNDVLIPDRDACVITVEMLNVFNRWLDENGHNKWSKETFHPRFAQHAETARNRVDKRQVRKIEGLSRPENRIDWKNPFPTKPEVYRGVRFRGPKDDQAADQGESKSVQTVQTLKENISTTRDRDVLSSGLDGLDTDGELPRVCPECGDDVIRKLGSGDDHWRAVCRQCDWKSA